MIKTLSPYYINIPRVSPLTSLTCSQYKLELYIWEGLKTAVPTEASYIITKANPEALITTDKINISKLVNSFIEFLPVLELSTDLSQGNNQVWVKQSVYYTTTDLTEINVAQFEDINLAIKGYGYGVDGENQQLPTDKLLYNTREFKVYKNSIITLSYLLDESVVPTPSIGITNVSLDTGNDYIITFNFVGTYDVFTCVIYPNGTQPYVVDVSGNTSPQTVTITATTGLTGFQLIGFDTSSSQSIQSNIFQITI